jgi:hypothetical protein
MKAISLLLSLCVLAAIAAAQTPTPTPLPEPDNAYMGGVTVNPGASPAVAGTGIYARRVAEGTFAFTVIDALPTTVKPFTVVTNVGIGVAKRVLTIAGIPIYVPASGDISWTGNHVGWAWSTGGLAWIPLGKRGWAIAPQCRLLKSSISGGSGYGVMGGVLLGWGK